MFDEAGVSSFQQVIFAGFFALTRYEKKLFKKLLLLENTCLIFQAGKGMKKKLAELGVNADAEECEQLEPELHFYSSPDSHGQVYALRTLFEREKEEAGHELENTAIVLPSSETLFPLLRQGIAMLASVFGI